MIEKILYHKQLRYIEIRTFALKYNVRYWKIVTEGILFSNDESIVFPHIKRIDGKPKLVCK